MRIIRPSETVDDLRTLYRQGFKPGCSTGWQSLDAHWTVGDSQLTIVTGIPSHGKSSWLDSLLVNLISTPLNGKPWKFLVCSPEQEPLALHEAEIIERIVGKRFRQGIGRMRWDEAEEVALGILNERFAFVHMEKDDDFSDLLSTVYATCIDDQRWQWGIVLDPWNRLEHRRPSNLREDEYISEALSAAVTVKNDTKAHLFIVAHPSKLQRDRQTGERPVPTPYDISGAAHWFNKPDSCITIWRDPTAEDAISRRTRVFVQKVRWRHIGKAGAFVELDYDAATGRYSEQPGSPVPQVGAIEA